MPHPLIGKYKKAAFERLPLDQRLAAREEIKEALSGKDRARVSAEDRILLMQYWIATFDGPAAGTPDTPPAKAEPAKPPRKFGLTLARKPAPKPAEPAPAKQPPVAAPKSATPPTAKQDPRPEVGGLAAALRLQGAAILASLLGLLLIGLATLVVREIVDRPALPRSLGELGSVLLTAVSHVLQGRLEWGWSQPAALGVTIVTLVCGLALIFIPASLLACGLERQSRLNEMRLAEQIRVLVARGPLTPSDQLGLKHFARRAGIPAEQLELMLATAKRDEATRQRHDLAMSPELLARRSEVASAHFHVLFEQLNRIAALPNSAEVGTHILARTDGAQAEKAVWLVLQKM